MPKMDIVIILIIWAHNFQTVQYFHSNFELTNETGFVFTQYLNECKRYE